ncbi:hypothetical protein [Dethiosulfatarculus sandiegensis]|uniref:Heparinase II N-terminal domain-containing protein n=1 Tax=Dethiosulfatarculus sandiegensis TaxID=1429043 RepID=A0A0D2JBX0_9BACT|nr:hypothetical protein [Dethiosulfatarculus sandiegensis]KIX13276.1 hypothetical protein X474_14925 [Dethiosulfatarculus sandiegensis]
MAPGFAAAQDPQVEKQEVIHPGLLLTPKRLSRLKEIANQQQPSWTRLILWSQQDKRKEHLPQDGPGLALAALLLDDLQPQQAQKNREAATKCAFAALKTPPLRSLAQNADLICSVALTLDWAWQGFTARERNDLADWLIKHTMRLKDQGRGCFNSAAASALKLTAYTALAIRGTHQKADEIFKFAFDTRFNREIKPCLAQLGQGGGWFEGENLGARAGYDLVCFAAVLKTAAGIDVFEKIPWFQDRLGCLIFSLLPGSNQTGYFGPLLVSPSGDQVLSPRMASDLARLQMLMITEIWPQTPMTGWARALQIDSRRPGVAPGPLLPMEFLFFDMEAKQAPLTTAPLSWFAPDVGRAYSRSDWSDRATWISFSAGPQFAINQHLDALSLVIFQQALLMPPSGGYDGLRSNYALNYGIRSLGHNTLLIKDPKEYSWYDLRGEVKPKGTFTNDGGQRAWASFDKKGKAIKNLPWTASSLKEWQANQDIYKAAEIEVLEGKPRFTYMRANATKAYQGSTKKAARVVRHLFHLRGGGPQAALAPEVVAVIDDVVLNREKAKVGFVVHFPSQPQIPLDVKPLGDGRYKGPAQELRFKTTRARLTVVPLWPAQGELHLFGGMGKAAFQVNGKTYPPKKGTRILATWRAEYTGKTGDIPKKPQVFALLPAAENAPEPPQLRLLSTQNANVKGLVVPDAKWPRIVAVRLGEPDPKADLRYLYPGGKTRHIVAGLTPNQSYHITAGRNSISIKPGKGLTSSPGGMLSFLVEPRKRNQKTDQPRQDVKAN